MIKKYFLAELFLLMILVLACAQQPVEQQAAKAYASSVEKAAASQTKNPVLKIVSPNDGDLIKNSSVTVKVQADDFHLVPAGQLVKDGEGHFHVWLDSEKKLGPQAAFTFDDVESGKHTITAELVKSNHSSLSPKITKNITINVESTFAQKAEQALSQEQQTASNEFTVEADDNGFYPNSITAKTGDAIKINFKFRDDSIYFAGLDLKGPFQTLHYKLHSQQPLTASFIVDGAARIDSYWPSSGVHKATLTVQAS